MNIGQAARNSGLSAKMIRYYESVGLLPSGTRAANGYRQYDHTDLQRLSFIKHSRDLGFELSAIKQLLELWQNRERASADVKALASQHVSQLNQRIDELIALRDTLEQLVNRCPGNQDSECVILDSLQHTGCKPHKAKA